MKERLCLEKLGKELLFFDGGIGTLLQEKGLQPGELPETWNIERADVIQEIHKDYVLAGSRILLTNTFGANGLKFPGSKYSLKEVVQSAVFHAREGIRKSGIREEVYVALDVGPTGKLLQPLGDLGFEDAVQTFREVMEIGKEAEVDLIHIETMSDTYEIKAAVLAAKESTNLPVFVTVIFDEKGKLLTGGDVLSVVALLEGLGVQGLGINCGLGPEQMLPILKDILRYSSIPVIVKPNAGLPKQGKDGTFYDVSPEVFAKTMGEVVELGATIVGGCCGTTPRHIEKMVEVCREKACKPIVEKEFTLISSYGRGVLFGERPILIGERINPTGKKMLKEALKNRNIDYILKEGILQQEKGADVLDVNVGLPDIPEAEVMMKVIQELQSVTSLPLQIDTVNEAAMEKAMRIYNGKPMINSVNGKKESMNQVFPLVQKYGGVVVGLTIDESGIPDTAEGRVQIAKKLIEEAKKYGIQKKNIVIDVLAMTISSDSQGGLVTLEALERVRKELGVHTVLGVSNISFGLPNRPLLNAHFFTMAMQRGLSSGIINVFSEEMMGAYYAYCALSNKDEQFQTYLKAYGGKEEGRTTSTAKGEIGLKEAIEKGLKEEVQKSTELLLEQMDGMDIIQEYLIPALDKVGKGFEEGKLFLPHLLMSADSAKIAFEILKKRMLLEGRVEEKKEPVILATVKGDIHDIGKNIVKVLLENYGYDVIDLGKDVPSQQIIDAAIERDVDLVGLSALMTTTVANMEETIRLLREKKPDCKVMVGGAVLNQEYADQIGADFYGKDAMQSVYYTQKLFQEKKEAK